MIVAIIDYGSGNLRSVAKAFERVAGDAFSIQVTNSPNVVARASHIVLPGVGAFADCMNGLKALPGMLDILQEQVLKRGKQFLGICVGMQMLFDKGHEHGVHEGLGWLQGEVLPLGNRESGIGSRDISGSQFPIPDSNLKIPHMGWNDLHITGGHPLLRDIKTGDHAYFVHSYHVLCRNATDVLATVDYGQSVTAVVGRGNIMGTQFHPEKSQETGLRLLRNFLEISS